MKNIILTVLFTVIMILCESISLAQNKIPVKLLQGIETTTDEFTGEKTFYIKNCCLSIVQNRDTSNLYISLSCSSYDRPIKLKKIYILTNGETTEINDEFTLQEIPTRVMRSPSSGKFGTSSYRPATFDTRMAYLEVWRVEATPYLRTIMSIINYNGKVKFEGENDTLYLEFTQNDTKKMKRIFNLYKYLPNNEH